VAGDGQSVVLIANGIKEEATDDCFVHNANRPSK
jgi:hypothetical protein